MNRVLIIQPHRMLQQAMVLALAAEYAVRVSTTVDPGALGDVDAVIIDATALREIGGTDQQLTLVQFWRGPTVVIDEPDAADRNGSAVARIEAPITREALKSALAEVLGAVARSVKTGYTAGHGTAHPVRAQSSPAEQEKTKALSAEADKAPMIELVDIVEEKS
jgi:hypothetical protein